MPIEFNALVFGNAQNFKQTEVRCKIWGHCTDVQFAETNVDGKTEVTLDVLAEDGYTGATIHLGDVVLHLAKNHPGMLKAALALQDNN